MSSRRMLMLGRRAAGDIKPLTMSGAFTETPHPHPQAPEARRPGAFRPSGGRRVVCECRRHRSRLPQEAHPLRAGREAPQSCPHGRRCVKQHWTARKSARVVSSKLLAPSLLVRASPGGRVAGCPPRTGDPLIPDDDVLLSRLDPDPHQDADKNQNDDAGDDFPTTHDVSFVATSTS